MPRFALKGAVLNRKIIATGGVAFTGKCLTEYDLIDIYNPERDVWTKENGLSLPWPAAAHGMCIHSNCLYLFGGYSTEGIHTRAACYSPDSKEWRMLSHMDKPRAAMGVVPVGDEIYLIGGWEADGRTVMDTVTAYKV